MVECPVCRVELGGRNVVDHAKEEHPEIFIKGVYMDGEKSSFY